jgi:hypothetical protein
MPRDKVGFASTGGTQVTAYLRRQVDQLVCLLLSTGLIQSIKSFQQ